MPATDLSANFTIFCFIIIFINIIIVMDHLLQVGTAEYATWTLYVNVNIIIMR